MIRVPSGNSSRARISSPFRRSRRTAAGWPGSAGITRVCRGMAPNCGSAGSPTECPARGGWSRAACGNRCWPRCGGTGPACMWSPTGPAGGTSTRWPARRAAEALFPAEEEFAEPLWQLGDRPFARLGDGRLAALHGQGGMRLGLLDPETGELTDLKLPVEEFTSGLAADSETVVAVAGSPARRWPWSGSTRPPARPRCCAGSPRRSRTRATCRCPARSSWRDRTGGECTRWSTRQPIRTRPPRTVSCRPTWSGRTAAPPRTRSRCSTWKRPISPAAASGSSTSTTAGPPVTAAATASGFACSGAWSMSEDVAAARWSGRERRRRPGPVAIRGSSAGAGPRWPR